MEVGQEFGDLCIIVPFVKRVQPIEVLPVVRIVPGVSDAVELASGERGESAFDLNYRLSELVLAVNPGASEVDRDLGVRGLAQPYFERETGLSHDLARRVGVADIADMPRLVAVAGNVLLAFGIAQDEAVIGEFGVDLFPDLGIPDHILVVVYILAVDVEIKIESETGVML